MPRLAPKSLCLETEEREQLQQLLNRHNTPQQLVLRASIIVFADEGHNHREIARQLNISRKMARLWRERWIDGQTRGITVVERLQDAERSGAPATFELEQILHLFKLACDKPDDYNGPISHWSNRELADELVQIGVSQIPISQSNLEHQFESKKWLLYLRRAIIGKNCDIG